MDENETITAEVSKDDKMWALIAHLTSLASLAIIGPLVIYLIKKDESEYIKAHSLEALNFHITATVVMVLSVITIVGPFIIGLAALILSIMAAIKANEGQVYRYPFTIRLIK